MGSDDRGGGIVGMGFVILDRIHREGVRVAETLGGTCGNVLANLADLGHDALPVLRLGDDAEGRTLRDALARAGCDVSAVLLEEGTRSPILSQDNAADGSHAFSFRDPATGERHPRAVPATGEQVDGIEDRLGRCGAFFCDRLTGPIVRAMGIVAAAGGVVYFEPDPDTIEDRELFVRAMALCDVAKFSDEKFPGYDPASAMAAGSVAVVTAGAKGLVVRSAGAELAMPATPAGALVDASGSGDSVSTGALDAVVARAMGHRRLDLEALIEGIAAGQRLASANCSHLGARGLYLAEDRAGLRRIMARRGA